MTGRVLQIDDKQGCIEMDTLLTYKGQQYMFHYTHQLIEKCGIHQSEKPDVGNQTIEELEEVVKNLSGPLADFLKGRDISTLGDFDDKLVNFCQENSITRSTSQAVSIAALRSLSDLHRLSVLTKLKQIIGDESQVEETERPAIYLRLLSGGPLASQKFKPLTVGLVLNESCTLPWLQLLHLFRNVYQETENVLAKGKGGRDLVKPEVDGSYAFPLDTVADSIKVIEEVLKVTGTADTFGIYIDYGSYRYWNSDSSKYEFENLKKPSEPEEIEDLLAKLLLDKKNIKMICDPFILDHKNSWHRLNYKLKEKGHSVVFASKKPFSNHEEHDSFYADFTEADVPPKTKNAAELIGKYNQAKAQISERLVSFGDYSSISAFLKQFSELKKSLAAQRVKIILQDSLQSLHNDIFSDLCMTVGPNSICIGSPLQSGRFLTLQRALFSSKDARSLSDPNDQQTKDSDPNISQGNKDHLAASQKDTTKQSSKSVKKPADKK